MQLARDLHDEIGHTLSVVSVHAHVAQEAIGVDDGAARRAVAQIHASASDTMTELRGTVRLLRRDAGPTVPAPNLAGLNALVSAVREAGIAVDVDDTVPRGALSAPIEAAAYRIMQEALTNVLRHAGAERVQVRLSLADDRLGIEVRDDGRGGRALAGHGITGMTERARLLGGTVQVGGNAGGGYRVSADLPGRLGS